MESNNETLAYVQVLYYEYTCCNCDKVYKQYEDIFISSIYCCPYCDYIMTPSEATAEIMKKIKELQGTVKKQYEESKHHENNIHYY